MTMAKKEIDFNMGKLKFVVEFFELLYWNWSAVQ